MAVHDPRSDPELIAQTRAGDAAAYGVLWQRHQPAAWRAARALTSDRAAAEDAVGETFGGIHSALLNGAGPDIHFRAYLLTALRNNVARRARQDAAVVPSEHLPETEVVDDPLGDAPEKAAAVAAYQTLPERYRAVLWHAEIEREPMVEVAKAVGTTPAAAAQLLVRARRHLRRAYVQAHISHATTATTPDECRDARDHMGGYFVGGLAARENARLERHVHACVECKKVLGWASEAGAGLKAALLPAILGGAAGTKYLAGKAGLWGGAKAVGAASRRTVRNPAGGTAAAAVIILALLAALGSTHVISAISPAALFSSGSHHADRAAGRGAAAAPAPGGGSGGGSGASAPAPSPASKVTPATTPATTTTRPTTTTPAATTFTTAPPVVVAAPPPTGTSPPPAAATRPATTTTTTQSPATTTTTQLPATTTRPAPTTTTTAKRPAATPTTSVPPRSTTTTTVAGCRKLLGCVVRLPPVTPQHTAHHPGRHKGLLSRLVGLL